MLQQSVGAVIYGFDMTFDAHVLKILIASPGDTTEERDAVSDAIQGWNAARAEKEQVVLFPWRWEKHAVPVLGDTAQGVINAQAVDSADIVIAIFDSRLGKETENAVSGTAEEITRAHAAGKPVHVWFSTEDLPRGVDPEQLTKLNSFKEELGKQGLLGEYANPSDLAYRVRDAIEADVAALGLGAVGPIKKKGEHAVPRLRVESRREQTGQDSKGAPRFTNRHKLILENKSESVTAEGLRMHLGEFAHSVIRDSDDAVDLPPLVSLSWPLALSMGSPSQVSIELTWTENEEPHSVTLPVSTFG